MATLKVIGYVVACDPGINNFSTHRGEINVSDITPDLDLKSIINDSWFRSEVGYKFYPLHFIELREDGALLKYAKTEEFIPFGGSKKIDEVGLSYSYGELYVELIK